MSAITQLFKREPAVILSAVAAIIQAFALNGTARYSAICTVLAGVLTRQSVYSPATVESNQA